MIYAVREGARVMSSPKSSAFCPACQSEVIAKCGEINTWHWAHKRRADCDSWSEPESEWHIFWKEQYPESSREVVIRKDGVTHRADVVTQSGMVIEFQHSPISPSEIREREEFYENIAWVFDARKDAFFLDKNLYPYCLVKAGIFDVCRSFDYSWGTSRKYIDYCNCNLGIYLDIGNGYLFDIITYRGSVKNGSGYLLPYRDFVTGVRHRDLCHRALSVKLSKREIAVVFRH